MLSTPERVQEIIARQTSFGYRLVKEFEANNEDLLLFEYVSNIWMPLCRKIELRLFSTSDARLCFRAILSEKDDEKSFFICDNATENENDCGYGSFVMAYIIELAGTLKMLRITGDLSPFDIANESHPENRERVFHFYKKFGFEITLDEDGNSGSICLNLN